MIKHHPLGDTPTFSFQIQWKFLISTVSGEHIATFCLTTIHLEFQLVGVRNEMLITSAPDINALYSGEFADMDESHELNYCGNVGMHLQFFELS